MSHQLTLTERHKTHLPPAYRDANIKVKQLIYGCFFDHIDEAKLSFPEYSNAKCRRGKWLRHAELADHFPSGCQFDLIPKHLWPVPIELMEKIPLAKWQPSMFAQRCVMVRIFGHSCPFFVAPDDYPKQT